LPKGNWINYWNGEKHTGGKTIFCKVEQNIGGQLFVKGGSIVSFFKPADYIDAHDAGTITLSVYPEEKSTYTLYEDDGKTFDYEKGEIAKITFECIKTPKRIQFLINLPAGASMV